MPILDERSARFLRISLAVFDVAGALVVVSAVFMGLPARWWLVDGGAIVIAASLLVMAAAHFTELPWLRTAARIAGFFTLALGLLLLAALASSYTYLAAIYTPVGRGGSLICALVAALVIPYFVVLPAVQLLGFGRRGIQDATGA